VLRQKVAALLCLLLCVACRPAPVAFAQNTSVTVNVDAGLNRHPISPLIYGLAFASTSALADLNCPLNRSGGNAGYGAAPATSSSSSATHAAAAAKQSTSTPAAKQSTSTPAPKPAASAPATGIPQNNGGDMDSDNNGGPSDGDGNQ